MDNTTTVYTIIIVEVNYGGVPISECIKQV